MERPSQDSILDFYRQPSAMTSAGRCVPLFNQLPDDMGKLGRIIQGLVVCDVIAPEFYGFTISDDRQGEIHIRSLDKKLESLFAPDGRPALSFGAAFTRPAA